MPVHHHPPVDSDQSTSTDFSALSMERFVPLWDVKWALLWGCGRCPGAVHCEALRSAQQRETAGASPGLPDPTEEEDQQRSQTGHDGGPPDAGRQGDLLRGENPNTRITTFERQ